MDDYTSNPRRHDFDPAYPGGDRCRWCMFHEGAHRVSSEGDNMAQKSNINNDDIHNAFGYHKATDVTGPQHAAVRGAYIEFAKLIENILPDGRAKSLWMTNLEASSMWANKAVAEQAPLVYETMESETPKMEKQGEMPHVPNRYPITGEDY